MSSSPRICIVPRVSGVGGMVSFQHRLTASLAARRIEITHDLEDEPYDVVLVIGGTRQLAGLWRARRRGIPIVQRLDGMNWLHRRLPTGLRHYLRAEYGNRLLAFIRRRLAAQIVYQSRFVVHWWEAQHGITPVPHHVIYNGVDLDEFSPGDPPESEAPPYRLLLVEGSLAGGYEMGLQTAVQLAEQIKGFLGFPVELVVVGNVSPYLRARWEEGARFPIEWMGAVPRERIPEIDRSAHLLYSADLNPACPNAVIEALACGLPVVAFDTGALSEIVVGDAGRLAPYGGDPWVLDPPDVPALARAAAEILRHQSRFRAAARARAEADFSLDTMVDQYLDVLLGSA